MTEKLVGRTLASILPTIISGLYSDKYDIVREYCQNAYDAILLKYKTTAAKNGLITITISGNDIRIHDNGTGMTKDVVRKLSTIGYSTKDTNDQVGYRGIGRLSGICGARKIHFVTKSKDENVEYLFEIDSDGLTNEFSDRETKFSMDAGELLAKYSSMEEKILQDTNNGESYTTVVLHQVYGDAGKLLDPVKLKEYLELNLPLPTNKAFEHSKDIESLYSEHLPNFPNISIQLNGQLLTKPFHLLEENKSYERMILKNAKGKVLAASWYTWDPNKSEMINNERLRGLRFRHKGFTIGDPGDMRNLLRTSPQQIPDWFSGEVIVVDGRALISSDRSRFEDTISRSELNIAMEHVLGKNLSLIARDRSSKISTKRFLVKGKLQIEYLNKILTSEKYKSKEELQNIADEANNLAEKIKNKTYTTSTNRDKNNLRETVSDILEKAQKVRKKAKEENGIHDKVQLSEQSKAIHSILKIAIKKHCKNCKSANVLLTKIDSDILNELK
ncbi:MAG: hypothetical protein UT63_C0010G0008 [Candidatus Gottesmanbacteria bacterium GW2011_GWC2_39_8]|uniref:Uncharacterized protein n=1 Tax=Candidatus Gottesmanbacteria bacterium GW2011_GWC2_39_8 TaxID=1618450 RepID=A0A0G0Q0N0_9BACT|nr:MAG: hypothetical protein UT63_C0010G0008 [Candidatus Gottesmanbacteria bacterium GW2011_GWC2_39_8]